MKTYIQKGLAVICSLLIAAGLPIASMMASAEDVSLDFEANSEPLPDVGDVNGQGGITASDALMALQISTAKFDATAEQIAQADVNGDGKVSAADALQILQCAIEKITEFTPVVDVLPPSTSSGATLDFAAEKAGDQIILSVNVAGLDGTYNADDKYTNAWNVLECSVAYDADQVTPVQQNNGLKDVDYLPGDALYNAMVEVNLTKNPILVGVIDAYGQYDNGEVMNIAFQISDDVRVGDTITLTVDVSQFAKAIIVDGKMEALQNLVMPGAYTTTLTVGERQPSVDFIEVTKQPDKTVYQWGEALDLTGMEITAFYSDNATKKVSVTSDMVSGYNPYKAGPQSLTVTYEGKTTTFVVTVEEQVIPISIAVTSRPDKTDYQWGEELDLTGMEITVYYSNDTTKVVPVTSAMVSGYDPYHAGTQTLTVNYEGQINTFVVTVNEPVVLESIVITKSPDKTAYQQGEELELTGAKLTAFYDDGSTESVAITSDMVSGYDPYKIGQQPLTVTYGGRTTTFVVTVEGPALPSSIAVTKQPDKTDYQQGEELDLTGAELTAFYSDGTMETVTITPDMVSGYDSAKIGPQALTVTYKGETTTFVVIVNEPVMPESIVITKSPDKTAYRLGEELDLTGAELTAFYDDGSTETVAISPDMVSGYDSAKIGTQALTVTCKGKTTTFAVTVYRPGDVNLDGEVKSEDALTTLQAATHKIELTGAAALAANVNGDTEISSVDALQILQYATQKIDSFSSAQEVNQ